MILLNGIEVRNNKRENLRSKIEEIKSREGDEFIPPTLVIIQIGNNSASGIYIKQKKNFAEYIGAEVLHINLPEHIEEREVILEIQNYNLDSTIHGIIVQLPLPRHLSVHNITNAIDYTKDVDGLSNMSLGLLVERNFKMDASGEIGKDRKVNSDQYKVLNFKGFIPATAKAVLMLLDEYEIDVEGKNVCVVGRSVLVGKPTALLMLAKNATVTVCHSKTKNLKELTSSADILISAIGANRFIDAKFVSKGQVVIDVGINSSEIKNEEGVVVKKLFGDVAFEEVSKIVSAISPVPGGVGAAHCHGSQLT